MADMKYTKSELSKKTAADIAKIAEDEGIDTDEYSTKKAQIEALLEIEIDPDEVDAEEADIEDDEELDDEAEDDEEGYEYEPEEDEVDEVEEPAKPAAKKSRSKAAAKTDGEATTLAAKQVATALGTEAKTLRQFFRSPASTVEAVGSGGRYEFNESDLPKIKEEFDAWKAGHASRGAKRTGEGSTRSRGKRGPKVAEVTEVEEVEELEIEELEDEDLDLEDED